MKKTNIILSVILIIIILIFTLVVGPFISYWLAYFGGWIASEPFSLNNSKSSISIIFLFSLLITSIYIPQQMLFNTTYFTPENIPALAALLGWIGGFFKSSIVTKTISQKLSSDKKND